MNLIPKPKHIQLYSGDLPLAPIKTTFPEDRPELDRIISALNTLGGSRSTPVPLTIKLDSSSYQEDGYYLKIDIDGITVHAATPKGVFYALQTLRQIAETEKKYPFLEIHDEPDFPMRGILYDTTRGRVPTVNGLKKIADFCASLKLNTITLYFEHSFAFSEFSGIVSDEECLTPAELREFVEYCRMLYINVIPSVALFGHQYKLLQNDQYKHLCELENYTPTSHYWQERMLHHSFDISNPDSFTLVKSFIDQLCDVFPYNIYLPGVDETFDLCKGKNKDKNVIDEYCMFVDKICSYLNAKGKTALIADDIIQKHNCEFSLKSKNIIFFHWDYSREPGETQFDILQKTGFPHISAPSVWSHSTLVESLFHSEANIPTLIDYAYKHGSMGIINTVWGDYGHFCDFNCTLYGIALGSEKSWNASTEVTSAFELDFSAVVYDEHKMNMVDIIRAANDVSSSSGVWYWVRWYSKNILQHCKTDFENPNTAFAQKNLVVSREFVQKLMKLKEAHPAKGELLDSLCIAFKMSDIFNLLVLPVTNRKKLSKEDIDNIFRIIEEYHALWLRDNKPGEFKEIPLFINALISHVNA